MSGGRVHDEKALKNKRFGAVLAWLFALFAVIASFGIGNMTQEIRFPVHYIRHFMCRPI